MNSETCIFCKIIRKEIPSSTVYEDDRYIAFLSIAPRSPGHTLVVPKEHHRWVWDVPEFGDYFALARRIALAQREVFGQELVCCHVEGEEVPHAHIWIYPDPNKTEGDKKDFAGNAKKIAEAMK